MYDRAERSSEGQETDALTSAAATLVEETPVRRSAMVVGRADDPYEREADRVAAEVTQRLSSQPTARRSGGSSGDPLGGTAVSPDIERQIRA
ncbi:MAG: hypothetical protein ABMA25_08865, partial [Ilumatobacteraceae bacterium]